VQAVRRGLRLPVVRLRALGLVLGREEHRQDVEPGDAVDQGVVGLGQDREPPVPEPLDQPHLPQRLLTVQVRGEDARGERLQLVLGARLRQRGRADVETQVEVLVVDPLRPALAEGHVRQFLAVARHHREPRLHVIDELVVRGRVALEDHHGPDVHGLVGVLQVEERSVQRGQSGGGHSSYLSCGSGAKSVLMAYPGDGRLVWDPWLPRRS
jgi:hypothetical protein